MLNYEENLNKNNTVLFAFIKDCLAYFEYHFVIVITNYINLIMNYFVIIMIKDYFIIVVFLN